MPNFSPDVTKFPGAASCALRLLIARFFGWNTFSEWFTQKTDRPRTVWGESLRIQRNEEEGIQKKILMTP